MDIEKIDDSTISMTATTTRTASLDEIQAIIDRLDKLIAQNQAQRASWHLILDQGNSLGVTTTAQKEAAANTLNATPVVV